MKLYVSPLAVRGMCEWRFRINDDMKCTLSVPRKDGRVVAYAEGESMDAGLFFVQGCGGISHVFSAEKVKGRKRG